MVKENCFFRIGTGKVAGSTTETNTGMMTDTESETTEEVCHTENVFEI